MLLVTWVIRTNSSERNEAFLIQSESVTFDFYSNCKLVVCHIFPHQNRTTITHLTLLFVFVTVFSRNTLLCVIKFANSSNFKWHLGKDNSHLDAHKKGQTQHFFKEILLFVIYLEVRCYVCYIRYCELQRPYNVTYSRNNNYGTLMDWYWQGKPKCWEKNLSQCHLSTIDLTLTDLGLNCTLHLHGED